jgi:hypothetical protein
MDQTTVRERFLLTAWLYMHQKEIVQRILSFVLCGIVTTLLAPDIAFWTRMSAIVAFISIAPIFGIIAFAIGRYVCNGVISASLEHTSKYPLYL